MTQSTEPLPVPGRQGKWVRFKIMLTGGDIAAITAASVRRRQVHIPALAPEQAALAEPDPADPTRGVLVEQDEATALVVTALRGVVEWNLTAADLAGGPNGASPDQVLPLTQESVEELDGTVFLWLMNQVGSRNRRRPESVEGPFDTRSPQPSRDTPSKATRKQRER